MSAVDQFRDEAGTLWKSLWFLAFITKERENKESPLKERVFRAAITAERNRTYCYIKCK